MKIINLLTLPIKVLTPLGSLTLDRPGTLPPVEVIVALTSLDDEGVETELRVLDPKNATITYSNLPEEIDGTVFVVPKTLASALMDRSDLFYPEPHPHAAGHVLLVHAASLNVISGHDVMRAEHPEIDTTPEPVEEVAMAAEAWAEAMPAHEQPAAAVEEPEIQPGNVLAAR